MEEKKNILGFWFFKPEIASHSPTSKRPLFTILSNFEKKTFLFISVCKVVASGALLLQLCLQPQLVQERVCKTFSQSICGLRKHFSMRQDYSKSPIVRLSKYPDRTKS